MTQISTSGEKLTTGKQALGLVGWLGLALATGAVGAVASVNAREFYAELQRPSWAPPGWVFGPVWTTLYVMMGIAAWLVWRERCEEASGRGGRRKWALGLFVVQLVANALWSWLFFAWKLGAAASVEIVVLWALIVATVVAFWRLKAVAGVLLLPYLAWVTFAVALCWTVWRMNPVALGG